MPNQTLTPWLDCLRNLLPPTHITLIGAGSGSSPWVQWLLQCTQLPATTLLEADSEQYQLLEHRLAAQHQASQIHALNNLVAPQKGESSFYVASLTAESSLLPPAVLSPLWPNLQMVQEQTMTAITLQEVLSKQLVDIDNDNQHLWLMIDCLPVAPLLRNAEAVLRQVDVVLARVLLTKEDNSPIRIEGANLVDVTQLLRGMQQVALQSTRHPAIAYALFVRDYRSALQQQTQTTNAIRVKLNDEVEVQAELHQKLKQATQAHQGVEAKLAQQSQAAQDLQAKLDTETQAKTELQQKLKQATQTLQRLETELAQQLQAVQDLQVKLDTETQAKTELQQKLKQATQTLQGLKTELAQQSQAAQKLQAKLDAEARAKAEQQEKLQRVTQAHEELGAELTRQAEATHALQAKLDAETRTKTELQRKLEQATQTRQKLETELARKAKADEELHIKLNTEIQSKADLQKSLAQAVQLSQDLKVELAKKADLEALFKKQADDLISVRRFLDTSLKKEITNAAKQVEAFVGLQSYFATGELPSINIERQTWPVSPDFSFYLVELLEHNAYDLIIEFGSGISTVIIARTLVKIEPRRQKKTPVKFISFDHLEQYYQQTRNQLVHAGLQRKVQLCHTPLQDWQAPDGSVQPFYACQSILAALSKKYSVANMRILVVVDGPPAATGKHARYPAGPLILKYFSGAQVDLLLDDYIREDEKEVVQRWEEEFVAMKLACTTTKHVLEKDACLMQIRER